MILIRTSVGNIHLVTLSLFIFRSVLADIMVISPDKKSVQLFMDKKVPYTTPLPENGIFGYLVRANTPDACSHLEPPPKANHSHGTNFFLLADLFTPTNVECSNQRKIQKAAEAGYKAIILYNPHKSFFHDFSYLSIDRLGPIPAVIVSHQDGEILNKQYLWQTNYAILITSDLPPNLSYFLLPFAFVIGICLVLTISFMVFQLVRCVQERQRVHRHRLPKKFLKKLPLQKFEKGIYYETCAICLEDYVEGERIRILPCNHAYHTKCIDPWLTKNRRVCPFCKCKIRLPGMPESDSSDSDNDRRQPNFNESAEHDSNEYSRLIRSTRRTRTRPNFGNFFNLLNSTESSRPNPVRPQNTYGTGNVTRNEPIDNTYDNVHQPGPSHSSSAPTTSRYSLGSQEARNKRRTKTRRSHNREVVTADVAPVIVPSQPSINCDAEGSFIEWNESTSERPSSRRTRRESSAPTQTEPIFDQPSTIVNIENVTSPQPPAPSSNRNDLSDYNPHIV